MTTIRGRYRQGGSPPTRMGGMTWTLVAIALLSSLSATTATMAPGSATHGAATGAGFWPALHFYQAIEKEHYQSLDEMALAADAVVVGRVVAVSSGRVFGEEQQDRVAYGTTQLQVEEVLMAVPAAAVERVISLEVMLPYEGAESVLEQRLPTERGLYFLRNKGLAVERQGYSAVVQRDNAPYWRLVSSQGLFETADGRITVPMVPAHEEGFPAGLAGTGFASAVNQLRDLAGAR